MNLYVWNEPYRVNYGSSVLYAVAETEAEARVVAANARVSKFGFGPSEGGSGGINLGAPDRVLPVPCAEIYEWSE